MECLQKRRNCAQDKALLDLMNKKYFTLRAQNMGISWEKVYIIFVSMMRYPTDINITLEDEGKILNVAGTKLRIPQILEGGRYPQIMLSFCGGGRIGIQNFLENILGSALDSLHLHRILNTEKHWMNTKRFRCYKRSKQKNIMNFVLNELGVKLEDERKTLF